MGEPVLRMLAAATVAVFLAQGAACASRSPEDAEDTGAFQDDMRGDLGTVDALLQQTRDGHNVSSFGMGMFAMTVLNDLASRDADLSSHIQAGGRSTDTYLSEVFQAHPLQEEAALQAMADQGSPTLRLAAEHMLEALRHVPDRNAAAAIQDGDRRKLAAELAQLRSLLNRAISEAAP